MISFPIISSSINTSKTNAYKHQVKIIENAARTYISQNDTKLPESGEYIDLTVADLKEEGLIQNKDIKNPIYEKNSTDSKKKFEYFNGCVKVTNNSNKYTYKYRQDCNGPDDEEDDNKIVIYRQILENNSRTPVLANKGSSAASRYPYKITNLRKGVDYITESDYPSYRDRANILKSRFVSESYYLKHDVVNDEIINTYLCFISDQEYCMKGANETESFTSNKEMLKKFQTYYNLNDVTSPSYSNPGCSYYSTSASCFRTNYKKLTISSGTVSYYFFPDYYCTISNSGSSYCDACSECNPIN